MINRQKPMLLLIDNYDSFTYNLSHAFEEIGCQVLVKRNDEIMLTEVQKLGATHIVIGPGPGSPKDIALCTELILELGPYIPTLGVCLGHQYIAECFGAKVIHALAPIHGKISFIKHVQDPLFNNIAYPMAVGRYHSLVVEKKTFPPCLEILAVDQAAEEIMAFKHKKYPIYGVQFHPESILTHQGIHLLKNFIS